MLPRDVLQRCASEGREKVAEESDTPRASRRLLVVAVSRTQYDANDIVSPHAIRCAAKQRLCLFMRRVARAYAPSGVREAACHVVSVKMRAALGGFRGFAAYVPYGAAQPLCAPRQRKGARLVRSGIRRRRYGATRQRSCLLICRRVRRPVPMRRGESSSTRFRPA